MKKYILITEDVPYDDTKDEFFLNKGDILMHKEEMFYSDIEVTYVRLRDNVNFVLMKSWFKNDPYTFHIKHEDISDRFEKITVFI